MFLPLVGHREDESRRGDGCGGGRRGAFVAQGQDVFLQVGDPALLHRDGPVEHLLTEPALEGVGLAHQFDQGGQRGFGQHGGDAAGARGLMGAGVLVPLPGGNAMFRRMNPSGGPDGGAAMCRHAAGETLRGSGGGGGGGGVVPAASVLLLLLLYEGLQAAGDRLRV